MRRILFAPQCWFMRFHLRCSRPLPGRQEHNEENPMSRFRSCNFCNLSLAIAAALVFAPAAFAQDDTTNTSSTITNTTPGKRFAVVAGYAHLVPKSDPGTLLGAKSDIDGSGAPTLSGSWYVNDNFAVDRSEEHTSELQSPCNLVCRLLLEKKKYILYIYNYI